MGNPVFIEPVPPPTLRPLLSKSFGLQLYQYKRRTQKRWTLQSSDSTNVGLTNVGLVQTSDFYKRWTGTGTNVGLVKTSGRVHLLEKTSDFWLRLKEKIIAVRNK